MKTFLITGGMGYIGSHLTTLLLQEGYRVIIIDNLCNSVSSVLSRIEKITCKKAIFVKGDIRNKEGLDAVFKTYAIDAVFHFAGLKAVDESISKPLDYFENNVTGTLNLCQSMSEAGVFKLVFSSSASVYGTQSTAPFREEMPISITSNPYSQSKAFVEAILEDLVAADRRWSVSLLRYFNPIGAHESGLIGENPKGTPRNLLPLISKVAVGRLKELKIFGNDYPTEDGTAVRDYIHVMDLAEGHMKALLANEQKGVLQTWNLGTGRGYSVLQVVQAFESVSGRKIPFSFAPRRPGDIAESWANSQKAARELNWQANRNLEDMMRDSWRWQLHNPNGIVSD